MEMFLLVGLLMSVTVGLFLAIILTAEMRRGWKKVVITIILTFGIGFGISTLLTLERMGDEKAWNNDYCECGAEWELINVEHLRNSGNLYHYGCGECGAVIETHSNFRE